MEGLNSTEVFVMLVVLSAVLAVYLIYLYTLHSVLNEVSPDNRAIKPGQVWLMLIPVFNIVWSFILVGKIGDSVRNEFEDRNISIREERPGYTVGVLMSLFSVFSIIPMAGLLFSVGAFSCWIVYWIKMSNYKSRLSGFDEIL